MLRKIGKHLGSLSALAMLAAAALLSVGMGCGGSAVDPSSNNNNVVINAATDANKPIATFAMTVHNGSTRNLVSVSYTLASSEIDGSGTRILTLTPITQVFDPQIHSGGSFAAQISYNIPAAGQAMTLALVVRDSSGGSEGFNLVISNDGTSTTITPADGSFTFN